MATERVTIKRLTNSLLTIQRLTKNNLLEINNWNGRYSLYQSGERISDYLSKRDLYLYLQGYMQIRRVEKQ